MNKSVLKKFVN